MLENVLSLLTLVTIGLAAFGIGRPLVRLLRVDGQSVLSTAVWSIGLGLICAGGAWTGLGLFGLLYRPLIAAVTLAGGCWGIVELVFAYLLRRYGSAARAADVFDESRSDHPPHWVQAGVAIMVVVALLGSLTSALAPPTAGDALCYHLQLPKVFLAEQALVYLPDCDNSTFPLLVEMLYLWGLALEGPVAAQLLHWGLGVLLAGAAIMLAEPVLGRSWSPLVGAIVLLVPGVTNQMTAPLNDVALATFSTLALAAWWRGAIQERRWQWLALAGVFLGAACGTKYVALLFALALALVWLYIGSRSERVRRMLPRAVAITTAFLVLVAGVWYARAAVYRGNPVYPFFGEMFAGAGLPTIRPTKTPLEAAPLTAAFSPWTITMRPGEFGGRGHQLGGFFLLLLPGLVVARRLRGLRTLLVIALIYYALWYVLRQNVRFLFPLIPLLAVPCVWVLMELRRAARVPRLLAIGACTSLLLVGAALPVYRARHTVAVALGQESREDYLLRTEPTYVAAQVANRLCSAGGHILSQDHRGFYFDAQFTRENIYRRRTSYEKSVSYSGTISPMLHAAGFSHVLLAESSGEKGVRYDGILSKLVDRALADGGDTGLRRMLEYEFSDADGAIRRYRLFALK